MEKNQKKSDDTADYYGSGIITRIMTDRINDKQNNNKRNNKQNNKQKDNYRRIVQKGKDGGHAELWRTRF